MQKFKVQLTLDERLTLKALSRRQSRATVIENLIRENAGTKAKARTEKLAKSPVDLILSEKAMGELHAIAGRQSLGVAVGHLLSNCVRRV